MEVRWSAFGWFVDWSTVRKLPVPQNSIEEEQNQSKDIELLISKDIIDENKKEQTSNSDEDFLKLLLNKIKNN